MRVFSALFATTLLIAAIDPTFGSDSDDEMQLSLFPEDWNSPVSNALAMDDLKTIIDVLMETLRKITEQLF